VLRFWRKNQATDGEYLWLASLSKETMAEPGPMFAHISAMQNREMLQSFSQQLNDEWRVRTKEVENKMLLLISRKQANNEK
ncbi:MAG: hypothetical protein R3240_00815, partial [Gammaproteobacteria bacterium]|nr:hypothetical protein [Gammaproteobacteria bacterium]